MSILNSSPPGIFRRKPVDEIEPENLEEGGGLQRVLGLWQLTAIGIGGIIGAGIFSLAGFLPIAEAAELTNIGILVAFAVVCSAVIVLRYRSPEIERGFRTPGMPVIPLVGVASSIWLTTYLTTTTWVRFGVWLVIGLTSYAAYSYRHSHLNTAGTR